MLLISLIKTKYSIMYIKDKTTAQLQQTVKLQNLTKGLTPNELSELKMIIIAKQLKK